jgi:AbrB family looped-hinge helix DNA binding protein
MSIVKVDRRGRIILPKKLRESLGIGEKVLVVNLGDHLRISPLPSDPFEALEGTLSINKSFKELRKQAELVAKKEATVELS